MRWRLCAATLDRERIDKKTYATVSELLSWHVSPSLASALAPYQRGRVEFILDKEGRKLLADEMGLGKEVQAIAAMSAFWGIGRYWCCVRVRRGIIGSWIFGSGRGARPSWRLNSRIVPREDVGGIMMPKFGESRASTRKGNDLTTQ